MIWFNLFVGYFLYHQALRPNKILIETINECDSTLKSSNDSAILIERKEDRVAQQSENRAKWTKCRDDLQQRYRRRLDKIHTRIPFVAAAALGTITFGWFIVGFGIIVTRLIRRKFK